jgi:hypothetical protein
MKMSVVFCLDVGGIVGRIFGCEISQGHRSQMREVSFPNSEAVLKLMKNP